MPRVAAVAALSSSLILSLAGPATAQTGVDVTPPVVTFTGLTEGQAIGPNLRFKPAVTDDVGVVSVHILVNGVYANTMRRVDGEFYDVANLHGVAHDTDANLTIRAWDAARNHGDLTVRVRGDLMAPTAGAISPAESTTINGVTTVTVSDVSPDTARVQFSNGSAVLGTATASPWSLRWDVSGPVTSRGMYITVEDHAGNETQYNRVYRIDSVGPDIWAGPNWIPEVVGPGVGHLAVSYESNPADVARVEWWIDGALRSTDQIAKVDFGKVSRTANVEVRAFDALGNVSVLSRKVRVDATSPTVTSVTPAQGSLVRGDQLLTEIKATDANGISGVTVIDPANGRHTLASAPYRLRVWIGDGPATVTWQVYDRLGNVTVVRRTVLVDNVFPQLRVTKAPKNGAKVKGTVRVTAKASDKNGIARVELLINGKVVAKDVKPGYSFSIKTKKYGKKIKVQMRAYDKAGNVTLTPARVWKR